MKKLFDYLIIGAGPSAAGTLFSIQNFKNDNHICILTGEDYQKNYSQTNFLTQKKISKEKFFMKYEYKTKKKNFFLLSSRIIGGLTNFWGEQFELLLKGEFPKEIFKNYQDYINICKIFQKKLEIKKPLYNINLLKKNNKSFHFKNVNLVKSKNKKNKNIVKYLLSLEKNKNIKYKNQSVKKILKKKEIFEIQTFSGEIFSAKKVLIASGLIGTKRILYNSFEELNYSTFKDHYPSFVFFLDIKNKIQNLSNSKNFLSLRVIKKHQHIFFSNIYDITKFNLTTALNFFGIYNTQLNVKFPRFLSKIKAIQFWTRKSIVHYKCKKNQNFFYLSVKKNLQSNLSSFFSFFKKHFFIFYYTFKDHSYHYHDLKFKYQNKYLSVNQLLKLKFGKKILCVDGSILKSIGSSPHTLTLIASAFKITEKLLKNKSD